MRTTIDLPNELFREAKTRAVQQGTTLKHLITQYIRSGLGDHVPGESPLSHRRGPPPVAIRRIPGHAPAPARTNRQLNTILEEEEVRTSPLSQSRHPHRP